MHCSSRSRAEPKKLFMLSGAVEDGPAGCLLGNQVDKPSEMRGVWGAGPHGGHWHTDSLSAAVHSRPWTQHTKKHWFKTCVCVCVCTHVWLNTWYLRVYARSTGGKTTPLSSSYLSSKLIKTTTFMLYTVKQFACSQTQQTSLHFLLLRNFSTFTHFPDIIQCTHSASWTSPVIRVCGPGCTHTWLYSVVWNVEAQSAHSS